MLPVLTLLACAVAVYVACQWFVNAVEWLGARLHVGTIAVGTVLAAVGTALPESVVTLVAVLFGNETSGNDIAIGAAMGGPLVVGTLAYGVTGVMLLLKRQRIHEAHLVGAGGPGPVGPRPASDSGLAGIDVRRLARDQRWFLAIFVVKVALGLVAFSYKPLLGLVFFAAYAAYFVREVTGSGQRASESDLAPLRLQPRRQSPATWAVLVQTTASLALIFVASQLFVRQLEWAGPALGLPAVVVALLLSPIATELPEILNAVIWVRQGKLDLALGNISGAMMIQATVPSGIALLATDWRFDTAPALAGFATLAAIGYLLFLLSTSRLTPRRLAGAGLFYVAFAVGLVITL